MVQRNNHERVNDQSYNGQYSDAQRGYYDDYPNRARSSRQQLAHRLPTTQRHETDDTSLFTAQPPRRATPEKQSMLTMLDLSVPSRTIATILCADGQKRNVEVYGYAYQLQPDEWFDEPGFCDAVDTAAMTRAYTERLPSSKAKRIVHMGRPWQVSEGNDLYEFFPLQSRGIPNELQADKDNLLQLSLEDDGDDGDDDDAIDEQDFCQTFDIDTWQYRFNELKRPASRYQSTQVPMQTPHAVQMPTTSGSGAGNFRATVDQHYAQQNATYDVAGKAADFLDSLGLHGQSTPVSRQRQPTEQPRPQSAEPRGYEPFEPRSQKDAPIPLVAYPERKQSVAQTQPSQSTEAKLSRSTAARVPTTSPTQQPPQPYPHNVARAAVQAQTPRENVAATPKKIVLDELEQPELVSFDDIPGTPSMKDRALALGERIIPKTRKRRIIAGIAIVASSIGGVGIHHELSGGEASTSAVTSDVLLPGQEYAWKGQTVCATKIAEIATAGTVALSIGGHNYSKNGKTYTEKQAWINNGMQQLDLSKSAALLSACAPSNAVVVTRKGNTEKVTLKLDKLTVKSGNLGYVVINKKNKPGRFHTEGYDALLKQAIAANDKTTVAQITTNKFPVPKKDGSGNDYYTLDELKKYNATVDNVAFRTEYDQLATAAVLADAQKNDAKTLQQVVTAPFKAYVESNAKKAGIKDVTFEVQGALRSLPDQYFAGTKASIKDPSADTIQLDGAYHDGMLQATPSNLNETVTPQKYTTTSMKEVTPVKKGK